MTLPLPRILINHPIEQPSYYIGGLLSSKWAIPDFINSKLGWFISLYNVYIYIYTAIPIYYHKCSHVSLNHPSIVPEMERVHYCLDLLKEPKK